MRTDRAEVTVAAPPAQVFACWTDPARLALWLPPDGMTARIDCFEPRPGGTFHLTLAYVDPATPGKAGEGIDVVEGTFLALDPPRHLAFASRFDSTDPAMQGTMRMDWHFDDQDAATRVRIAATDVPPGISPQDHAAGMGASLAQLVALFDPKG
jgi:uncharacterized protein YndB with AHSA1/START domain